MPQFIKMGLGGTGFLGHQETSQRAKVRFAKRRMVLPGFPVNKPFESINDVREYLGGDRIVCLLCGKAYKTIGSHLLKIHDMSADKYRERYKIPWTHALATQESRAIKRDIIAKRIDEGWIPNQYSSVFLLTHSRKRPCPFKVEIGLKNLGNCAGNLENIKKAALIANGGIPPIAKERHVAKRGSPEFHEKMRNRPQVKVTAEIFKNYWKGRRQSEEHKRKRFEAIKNAKIQGQSITKES